MKDIELIGPRVRVRRARPADAKASFEWFADRAVTEYLPLAGESSLPMENIVSFLEQASRDEDPNLSVGLELLNGQLFGCGGFRAIVPETSAEISVIVGEPALWGHGYGGEAMQLLLDYAFRELRLRIVWLIVRADNTRGVRLFTRLGFLVVETFEALVGISATPRDKHRMELTATRWTELRAWIRPAFRAFAPAQPMSPRRLPRILLAITGAILFVLAVTQVGPFLGYLRLRDFDWYASASPSAKREAAHRALAFRLGDPHDAFAILLDHGDASSIPYLRAALGRQPSSAGGIECTWVHGQLALERLERRAHAQLTRVRLLETDDALDAQLPELRMKAVLGVAIVLGMLALNVLAFGGAGYIVLLAPIYWTVMTMYRYRIIARRLAAARSRARNP